MTILSFLLFFFIILYIPLIIFVGYTLYALFTGAPFVPTSKKHVQGMLALALLKNGETLVDLGSGDGRIIFKAAKAVPLANCIGIEINPLLYYWSILKQYLKGVKNTKIIRQNLWEFDLSTTNVLTLFFISNKMERLAEKIKREMKPGSRVVSNGFKFSNWQYQTKDGSIYLYKV